MDKLRVRVYNVRFGDAIFVSVPERVGSRTETRHMLIDVGNALSGRGGDDEAFRPIIEDITRELDGRPLDLYVMTHEHLDHVQGLYYAKQNGLPQFRVSYAWLTASAEEKYYEKNPKAKERRNLIRQSIAEIDEYLRSSPANPTLFAAMLANNDFRKTDACVNYLRLLAQNTSYVYRDCKLEGKHPFTEAEFRVLAPEEDTSVYYGNFQPLALGISRGRESGDGRNGFPSPPPGVDAGSFRDLVSARRRGYVDTLLAIDRAANNTSVVLSLGWRGWRLLFPGDAEVRSWKEMNKRGVLQAVHFLKVSHHGSSTGLPPRAILSSILPEAPHDSRPRQAVVSTCKGPYPGVPDPDTLEVIGHRAALQSVEDLNLGGYVDVEFPG